MKQNPLILFYSQRSPFARRIRLILRKLNLAFEEKAVDVFEKNSELWRVNPLGLVPTLITSQGLMMSDSSQLLEYFQDLTHSIWPEDFYRRCEMRQASTLCAGLMQSAVSFFQENVLHEVPSPRWTAEHYLVIHDTLNALSQIKKSIWVREQQLTQAGWDCCVALEYLDLRLSVLSWRKNYPEFETLLEIAKKTPAFLETQPTLK